MKKKVVAACMTIALAAVAMGGATLAYFTAETQVEENVFSVGDVAITLDEPAWDKLVDQDKVITPNKTIAKDPTVTVTANSEECYVRLLVTVEDIDKFKLAFPTAVNPADGVFLLQNFVDWNLKWQFKGCTEADGSATYEFGYFETVKKSKDSATTLDPLFTIITIPADADNDDLANLPNKPTINIVAQAVQKQGFDTYEEAFGATFDA